VRTARPSRILRISPDASSARSRAHAGCARARARPEAIKPAHGTLTSSSRRRSEMSDARAPRAGPARADHLTPCPSARGRGCLRPSGCVPVTAKGRLVGIDYVVAQARQCWRRPRPCWRLAGAPFADVVKVTVTSPDIAAAPSTRPAEVFIGRDAGRPHARRGERARDSRANLRSRRRRAHSPYRRLEQTPSITEVERRRRSPGRGAAAAPR